MKYFQRVIILVYIIYYEINSEVFYIERINVLTYVLYKN